MNDIKRRGIFFGTLCSEINDFIDFKHKTGFAYTDAICALKAFDRFCAMEKNQGLTPMQLAEEWMKPGDGKPKYGGGHCVRQLGQYLTETGHPKAFTILSDKGNPPSKLFLNIGPFAEEIKEFVEHKRLAGRKYTAIECYLNAFDFFCAMNDDGFTTPQQFAEAWCREVGKKSRSGIGSVREFGLHLTLHGSRNAFVIPYSNGQMPKPAFAGYASLFAKEIELFLKVKRHAGLKYRDEELRLKDFDRFCNDHPDLSPQQLADTFIRSRKQIGHFIGRKSAAVIKQLGNYLTNSGCSNAFAIADKHFVAGPYADEIARFVAFKQSCGYKYLNHVRHLRHFDAFCALEENESLPPQKMADKWVLKREDEHPNTRAARVGPIRVFGKYLISLGHPKGFIIADDVALRGPPKPPYLFSGDDIDMFFDACAGLKPNGKDKSFHIVIPAAILFMYCMGVRTCELKIMMDNVNFDTGEVTIPDAKTGGRTIYMSAELSEFLFNYDLAIARIFPCRKYLFPASANRSRNDFADCFKEIWASSVPATEHGEPRFYDLRHHLLYRNVELCMKNGDDVNALRPYLMKHMGHRLPESFQYYFHLSPPIRKEVSRIKTSLDWMIPDVPEVPYE